MKQGFRRLAAFRWKKGHGWLVFILGHESHACQSVQILFQVPRMVVLSRYRERQTRKERFFFGQLCHEITWGWWQRHTGCVYFTILPETNSFKILSEITPDMMLGVILLVKNNQTRIWGLGNFLTSTDLRHAIFLGRPEVPGVWGSTTFCNPQNWDHI